MRRSFLSKRVIISSVVTAAVTSGLGIMINFATEWKKEWWAWVAVAVLTLMLAGAAALLTADERLPEFKAKKTTLSGSAQVDLLEGASVQSDEFTASERARMSVRERTQRPPRETE